MANRLVPHNVSANVALTVHSVFIARVVKLNIVYAKPPVHAPSRKDSSSVLCWWPAKYNAETVQHIKQHKIVFDRFPVLSTG